MSVTFTYHGAMCVHIRRSDGYQILLDPYVTGNQATKARREDFSSVDLILVTHYAFDHFGDTIELLQGSSAKLMCCSDIKLHILKKHPELAERLVQTIYGDLKQFGQTIVRTVRAYHVSRGEMEGIPVFGPPVGFVVQVEPNVTYYHTGDTCPYSDMRLIGEWYHPDVMCVGIDRAELLKGSREMTPREAAIVVSWIGPRVVIPTHYYEGSTALPDFLRHMDSFAPDTVIKPAIDLPFTFTPAVID